MKNPFTVNQCLEEIVGKEIIAVIYHSSDHSQNHVKSIILQFKDGSSLEVVPSFYDDKGATLFPYYSKDTLE